MSASSKEGKMSGTKEPMTKGGRAIRGRRRKKKTHPRRHDGNWQTGRPGRNREGHKRDRCVSRRPWRGVERRTQLGGWRGRTISEGQYGGALVSLGTKGVFSGLHLRKLVIS